MDWPIETSLEFLQLYELEPVIWNPKDPRHRNRNSIKEAWIRIQKSLSVECSILDLKRKRESLMATFRPLWRAKINRELSGGSDDGYKSNWFAFDAMARFLGGVYQPKIFSSEEITNDDLQQDDDNFEEDAPTDHLYDTAKPEYPSTYSIAGGSKERMKRKAIENSAESRQALNDECSLFTQLLVKRLRSFDEKTREILMNKIDNLVFQAKMIKLDREAQLYSSPSSSYNPSNDSFSTVPVVSALYTQNHIDTRHSAELDTRLRDDNSSNSIEFIVKEENEIDDFSDINVGEAIMHNSSTEKVRHTNKKIK